MYVDVLLSNTSGWAAERTVVGTTCLGEITGCALVLPQLKRLLHFVLFRRALLEHWLEKFERYTYSLVFFTEENTFEPAP